MENTKRYLGMLFGSDINILVPIIEKHVSQNSPYYQLFSVDNSPTSFISFYTNSNMTIIKENINKIHKNLNFMIFDISSQGDNFEIESAELKEYFLLNNLIEKNNVVVDEENLGLNDLLDLLSKNGYQSLTTNQKKLLEKYSKE